MTNCKYFCYTDFILLLHQFYEPYFRKDLYQALPALDILCGVDLGK